MQESRRRPTAWAHRVVSRSPGRLGAMRFLVMTRSVVLAVLAMAVAPSPTAQTMAAGPPGGPKKIAVMRTQTDVVGGGTTCARRRVFGLDVLQCSRCQGKMRLIACIEEPDVAKKILEHLGLRGEPLPSLRAQAPPVTLELFPAA